MILTHTAVGQDPGRGRRCRPATSARHALRRRRLRPRQVPPAPAAARDPDGDHRTWPATRHRSGHLPVGGRAHDLLAAFNIGWRPAITVLGRQGRGCSTPTTRSAGRPRNGAGLRVLADHDGLTVVGDDEPGPRALAELRAYRPEVLIRHGPRDLHEVAVHLAVEVCRVARAHRRRPAITRCALRTP